MRRAEAKFKTGKLAADFFSADLAIGENAIALCAVHFHSLHVMGEKNRTLLRIVSREIAARAEQ